MEWLSQMCISDGRNPQNIHQTFHNRDRVFMYLTTMDIACWEEDWTPVRLQAKNALKENNRQVFKDSLSTEFAY